MFYGISYQAKTTIVSSSTLAPLHFTLYFFIARGVSQDEYYKLKCTYLREGANGFFRRTVAKRFQSCCLIDSENKILVAQNFYRVFLMEDSIRRTVELSSGART